MGAPLVLAYNLDKKREGALRILCLKLNIRVRIVRAAEFAEPVGNLLRLVPLTDAPLNAAPFRDEMLVMANFGEKLFNALLQSMRAAHLYIPLKAVLTPTNMQWSSLRLHDELVQEREAMQKS